MRNSGILFADLEKTFTRATSRAQADAIQMKNFRKSAFTYGSIVIVMICSPVNRTCLGKKAYLVLLEKQDEVETVIMCWYFAFP